MQIAADVFHGVGRCVAAHQAQEHGLQHVFRIAGIACDAIGGAEDHAVMIAKDPFDLSRRGLRGFGCHESSKHYRKPPSDRLERLGLSMFLLRWC